MPLQMPVYTGLLQLRRELWHVQDLVLPRALPMIPAGVAAGVLLMTFWFARLIHLSLPLSWAVLYGVPALVAYWLTNRPHIEGRSVQHWLLAQASYPFQPRRLVCMRPRWRTERLRLGLYFYRSLEQVMAEKRRGLR